jgi:hypothetical protein
MEIEPRYMLAPRAVLGDDAAERLIHHLLRLQTDRPAGDQYAVMLGEDGHLHFVLCTERIEP